MARPSKATRVCGQVGCPNLVPAGATRCATHATDEFYTTREWRLFRAGYLTVHPYCVVCNESATDVDHIQPIRLGGARFDHGNVQALCHGCHARKTRGEQTSGQQ